MKVFSQLRLDRSESTIIDFTMSYKIIEVRKDFLEWTGVLEKTTGYLWWRKTKRLKVTSQFGIVWEWENGPGGPGYNISCELEEVVRYMKRKRLEVWSIREPGKKKTVVGKPTTF